MFIFFLVKTNNRNYVHRLKCLSFLNFYFEILFKILRFPSILSDANNYLVDSSNERYKKLDKLGNKITESKK